MALGLVLGGVGMAMDARARRKAGKAEAAQRMYDAITGKIQAGYLRRGAKLDIALATKAARAEEEAAEYIESAAVARLAAQGGVNDPTSIKIVSDIKKKGKLNALMAMWEGKEGAATKEMQAVMAERGVMQNIEAAGVAKKAGEYRAAATLFTGMGRLAAEYG